MTLSAPAPARPTDRLRAGWDGERWLLIAVTVYVLLFCVVPLVRLFGEVFALGAQEGIALAQDMLDSRSTRRATWHTIEASLGATAVSVLLGGVMALVVGLTDVRAKPVLVFLLILPLLIPAQISALAWLELVGPSSFVYALPGLDYPAGTPNPLYSREGIMLLMGIEHSPMVFLAVRAGMRALPRDLVEAAQASGAGPMRITATILVPLLIPAIGAGAALAFVSAIGNFGVPALLGIPGRYTMLTTLIYQRLNGFGPSVLGEVAVLAMILAAMATAGLALQAYALRRQTIAVERTAPLGEAFPLGRRRLPVEAAVWGVLLVTAVLPLIALTGTSFIRAIGLSLSAETFTLANYVYALTTEATARAFRNSFVLALLAAVATIAVSVPLGYLVLHRRLRVARLVDLLADAPYALPGIVLSIAVILVLLPPLPLLGISLYNSLWIILVAYLGRFLALGLRPAMSGLQQVEPQLIEAAQMAGAGSLRRLVTVVLPLVAPAAAAGGLLVFMAAFNELTVSALLWSTGNETLGVVVFSLYDEGNSLAAAAVAMLTVIATLAIALAATGLARVGRMPQGVLPWQT